MIIHFQIPRRFCTFRPYLKKGAVGVWDWQSSNNLKVMTDVVTKKITVQEALDIAQANWEASYEGIPEA